jgi:3-phosphoshikimate 1-carboxyvinyltransferase
MTLRQPGPARDHTLRMLRGMGAELTEQGEVIRFNPERFSLQPLDFTVPGDMSAAAFLLVAALTTPGSDLVLEGVNTNHTRAGLLETLQAMGGQLEPQAERLQAGEPVANLRVQQSALRGVTVGGQVVVRMIDEFPVFTVAALHAQGKTLVQGMALKLTARSR